MELTESSGDKNNYRSTTLEIKKMFAVSAGKMYRNENPNLTKDADAGIYQEEPDASFCLIKSHSQPDLRSITENPCTPAKNDSPATKSDVSFMQMLNMVSPTSDNVELNDTSDVIDYIFNLPPIGAESLKSSSIQDRSEEQNIHVMETTEAFKEICLSQTTNTPDNKKKSRVICKIQPENMPDTIEKSKVICQIQSTLKPAAVTTNKITKTQIFKTTPKRPDTPPRNPRSKNNSYKHIGSPVAFYIKNCPQVALKTNVRPNKPLPGMSDIPELVKSTSPEKLQMDKHNHNINLPFVAYKSAKKTEVIQLPDENKLPQSQWVQKITSFPRPTVIKHKERIHAEKKKETTSQENSCGNLSCYQADISVCTEKTAFTYK